MPWNFDQGGAQQGTEEIDERIPKLLRRRAPDGEAEETLGPLGIERAARYLSLLLRWNQKMSLTSIRKPPEVVERHFWEAWAAFPYLLESGELIDVGSGAGFPGVALSILRPNLEVTLLERRERKSVFLREVLRNCGLEQGRVVTEDLSEHLNGEGAGRYAMVAVRAVKLSFAELLPLLKKDGPARVLAWTNVEGGRTLEEELPADWDTLHWVRLHPSRDRALIVLERLEAGAAKGKKKKAAADREPTAKKDAAPPKQKDAPAGKKKAGAEKESAPKKKAAPARKESSTSKKGASKGKGK